MLTFFYQANIPISFCPFCQMLISPLDQFFFYHPFSISFVVTFYKVTIIEHFDLLSLLCNFKHFYQQLFPLGSLFFLIIQTTHNHSLIFLLVLKQNCWFFYSNFYFFQNSSQIFDQSRLRILI